MAALSFAFAAPAATAATATVGVSRDTFITEIAGNTTTPHGGDNYLYLVRGGIGVSGYRTFPLLWFDLSAFAGGTVSGTGQLTMTLTGSNAVPSLTVLVRQSLVSWAENTVTFANIGGTGFNEATQTGPNLSSTQITYTAAPQSMSFAVPASVVQAWVDSPAQNFGLLLSTPATTGSDDKVFSSREGSFAPSLAFDITPIPEPAAASLMICGLLLAGTVKFRRSLQNSRRHENAGDA